MAVFFDYLITGVVFVLVFSLLVLIHEFGHFYAAKKCGIKVEEFGLGLPPRLWGKKKGETIYSINWIPFGGFVKMLGEDSRDEKMLDNGRSFIAQAAWKRIIVVVAGVVMNFILAWFLVTGGFIFGIEPFWTNREDVLTAIDNGDLVLEEGLVVENNFTVDNSFEFLKGDVLVSFNGSRDVINFLSAENSGEVSVKVMRGDENLVLNLSSEKFGEMVESSVFYDYMAIPRAEIAEDFQGLRVGDLVMAVNEVAIYTPTELADLLGEVDDNGLEFLIYRDGREEVVTVEIDQNELEYSGVIVAGVMEESAAKVAGVLERDKIVSLNNVEVADVEALMEAIGNLKNDNPNPVYNYEILRDGEMISLEITPGENGLIGVYFGNILQVDGVKFYDSVSLSSILELKKEKYSLLMAPVKGFMETVRLSKLTVSGLANALSGFLRGDDVSDVVGGPIRIAQLTGDAVDAGVMPVLKLIAILSISLAVLNILPVPALDGGRLLFILVEVVTRRRVNQKFEAYVHLLGYLLLLGLIVLITYSDIVRIFAKS